MSNKNIDNVTDCEKVYNSFIASSRGMFVYEYHSSPSLRISGCIAFSLGYTKYAWLKAVQDAKKIGTFRLSFIFLKKLTLNRCGMVDYYKRSEGSFQIQENIVRFHVSKLTNSINTKISISVLSLSLRFCYLTGCSSAQRIAADHIAQYASFCPTALDAAANASIDMHNWSLPVVMEGEDGNSVAYQTVKACIFGLVEISLTASSKAATSSVLQGICSTVHMNVFKFFTSSLMGNDDYRLSADEIAKLFGTTDSFSELKQEPLEQDESILTRLFKYRVFGFLRIFICCPRSSLASFFELLNGTHSDDQSCAEYFLRQITSHIITDDIRQVLDKTDELGLFFKDEVESTVEGKQSNCETPTSDVDNMNGTKSHIPSSLMKMVNAYLPKELY